MLRKPWVSIRRMTLFMQMIITTEYQNPYISVNWFLPEVRRCVCVISSQRICRLWIRKANKLGGHNLVFRSGCYVTKFINMPISQEGLGQSPYMLNFHLEEEGMMLVFPHPTFFFEQPQEFDDIVSCSGRFHDKYMISCRKKCCHQAMPAWHALFIRCVSRELIDVRLDQEYSSLGNLKNYLSLAARSSCDRCTITRLLAYARKSSCALYEMLMSLCKQTVFLHHLSSCEERISALEAANNISSKNDFGVKGIRWRCQYGYCSQYCHEVPVDYISCLRHVGKKRKRQIEYTVATSVKLMSLSPSKGWGCEYKKCELVCYTSPHAGLHHTSHVNYRFNGVKCADSVTGETINEFYGKCHCYSLSSEMDNCQEDFSACLSQLRNLGFKNLKFKRKGKRSPRKRRKYKESQQMTYFPLLKGNPDGRKASVVLVRSGNRSGKQTSQRVLRSSNRALCVVDGVNSSHSAVGTLLSLLIDHDIILPRQKVVYRENKHQNIIGNGTIMREGIKCKCCKKVFSLAKFEEHAGSRSLRPAKNIFLSDSRSLLECQMQFLRAKNDGDDHLHRNEKAWNDSSPCTSDSICSVCYIGGELISCSYCPSSFHASCINLQDHQKQLCCPACRCRLCGQSLTPENVLCCIQCERRYHAKCTEERLKKHESCTRQYWFCSRKCSIIFQYLQRCLGRRKVIGSRLSYTILSSVRAGVYHNDAEAIETMTENHSRLWLAFNLLQECFVPIVESLSGGNLLSDILFNKRSELRRLNFQGFYTVLLERDDELVSVSCIRIHGKKVAEMPLIATHVRYRHQGMCRLLVQEVEKMLIHLGVEKLVLPAVPQLLDTWITSFGFTVLPHSCQLELLEYTFLNFEGAIMCEKVLIPPRNRRKKQRGRMQDTVDRPCSENHEVPMTAQDMTAKKMTDPVNVLSFPSCSSCKNIDLSPLLVEEPQMSEQYGRMEEPPLEMTLFMQMIITTEYQNPCIP